MPEPCDVIRVVLSDIYQKAFKVNNFENDFYSRFGRHTLPLLLKRYNQAKIRKKNR